MRKESTYCALCKSSVSICEQTEKTTMSCSSVCVNVVCILSTVETENPSGRVGHRTYEILYFELLGLLNCDFLYLERICEKTYVNNTLDIYIF